MYIITTISDSTDDKITCSTDNVRIDVDPKSVVQTSPDIFDEVENMVMSIKKMW